MIGNADKKPIRVFLQDGENDLDNPFGSWPLAKKQMAKALEVRGHDYKLVVGTGAHDGKHGGKHDGKHGGAIFSDSLRWLWRNGKNETP